MFHLRPANSRLDMWLRRGEVIAADIDQPIIATCVSGSLWITARDTGDLVLSSRQTVVIRHPGRVVIQAISPTRIELANPSDSLAA